MYCFSHILSLLRFAVTLASQPSAARPGMACRWSSHFWPWTAAGTTAGECGDGLALRLQHSIMSHTSRWYLPWDPHQEALLDISCRDQNLFLTCPCFLSAWQRCGGFREASSAKKEFSVASGTVNQTQEMQKGQKAGRDASEAWESGQYLASTLYFVGTLPFETLDSEAGGLVKQKIKHNVQLLSTRSCFCASDDFRLLYPIGMCEPWLMTVMPSGRFVALDNTWTCDVCRLTFSFLTFLAWICRRTRLQIFASWHLKVWRNCCPHWL